ncbi:recombinase family protein, partial [Shinella zoogloeoides]
RFSTDMQNDRSAEDQIDYCKDFAKSRGYEIVGTYADKAVSGASIHGRYNLQQMLQDAQAGKFSIIIVEALDRLSRDIADMTLMYRQLGFLNIRLISVNEGEANLISVSLHGLQAQMFREGNVLKIRRGMGGLIKQGLSAGGKAYGYRPVKKLDAKGELIRGELEIVPEEAAVVQRIFEDYAAGTSPKEISHQLTREGVPAPRGSDWSPSAIYGWASRGSGILRNSIYVGHLVWNKNKMIKNPDTGKRVSRQNPPEDWKHAHLPELRIISDELFERVQAQLAERSQVAKEGRIGANNRPKRLLSGLLKCAACGRGMSVYGHDKSGRVRVRCSKHNNSRTCPDPKTFYLEDIENLLINSLAHELATPERIRLYAERYIESRYKDERDSHRRRADIERRLSQIEIENKKLVNLMLQDGADTKALGAKTKENAEERDRLELELSRLPQPSNIVLHPTAITSFAKRLMTKSSNPYRSNRAKLEIALTEMDEMGGLGPVLRELIHSVTVYDDGDYIGINVQGHLTPFLQEDGKPLKDMGAVAMVAEEGFEPPTQGL